MSALLDKMIENQRKRLAAFMSVLHGVKYDEDETVEVSHEVLKTEELNDKNKLSNN